MISGTLEAPKTLFQDSLSLLPGLSELFTTFKLREIPPSELLFHGFCLFLHHSAAPKYFKTHDNQWNIHDFPLILLVWATLYWSALINTDQHWSILIANGQHWSTLINTGHHSWTLINTVNIDQRWSTLFNTDQHCSTLIIIDEHWLNMPSYSIPSHPLPYACIKGPAIPTQASESCGTSRGPHIL